MYLKKNVVNRTYSINENKSRGGCSQNIRKIVVELRSPLRTSKFEQL